jgi:hypothetical protein
MPSGEPSVSVVALKAEEFSPDGKVVTVSLTTKYSAAKRRYSIPLECIYDFVVDLRRLNAFQRQASTDVAMSTTVAPDSEGEPTSGSEPAKDDQSKRLFRRWLSD